MLVVHVLFARGREGPSAACRLLQSMRSASTTTVVRTPQHPTRGRPLVELCSRPPAFRRFEPALAELTVDELRMATRGPLRFHSRGQPRGHGPGASIRGFHGLEARLLPSRSLAVEASPQPDRLGHLVSQARLDRRLECRRRGMPPSWRPVTSSPDERRSRAAVSAGPAAAVRRTGPPPALSREGQRVQPHPRCLPSPDLPLSGLAPPSTSCPQSVD